MGLPEEPDALLAGHAATLDEALRYVGARLVDNTDVRVDDAGKIHVSSDKAIVEPPSLIDLRKRVVAMLPRVDIGDQILEVMGWVPNRKYFGPKRGMTFLNMINDQAFGMGHKIVAGTDRDCLHAIDLFFGSGTANLPEVLITDTGSYSDLVFGIAQLLGVDYRPALADLPD